MSHGAFPEHEWQCGGRACPQAQWFSFVLGASSMNLWLLCTFTRNGTPFTYWYWLRRACINIGRWTRQGKPESGGEFLAVTSVLKAIEQLRSFAIALIAELLVRNNQIHTPHADWLSPARPLPVPSRLNRYHRQENRCLSGHCQLSQSS